MPLAWRPAASTGPARSVAWCSKRRNRFGFDPQSRVCGYEPSAPGLHLFTAEMRPPRDAALKRFALNTDFLWHLPCAYPLNGLDGAQIASIKPASANLIGPDVSQRLTDAAWRIELRDGSPACLLLEYQADTDPTMLFRALHSVATLALKLSRDPPQRYSPSRSPPILHLTLYTGRRAWSIASVDAESTEANEPFWHCVSRLCQLLDLRRLPDPGGKETLAVLLARLQRCEEPQTLRRTAPPLREWASDPAHAELASAFAAWVTYVILPDMGIMDVPVSDSLGEVLEMLEQEPRTWADRMR